MKYGYRFLYVFLMILSGISTAWAQNNIVSIYVKSRPLKKEILLRWAPSTSYGWRETNKSGFFIDRYTVMRNGEILAQPEHRRLTENPLKAMPIENWESIIQENDYAAIIAQALYGENFSLSTGTQQGFAQVYALSQEQEQRFSMSLFAADQDFQAACFAGWGYRDTNVASGERYLYRIIPAFTEDYADSVEIGIAYLSVDEYKPLPKPLGLTAEFRDQNVMLSWNYDFLKDFYNSYYLEKSEDGTHYQQIPGPPISQVSSEENPNQNVSRKMTYMDSLPNNQQQFFYRVKGVTTFGEIGPCSDSVFGKGISDFPFVPFIVKALINSSGEAEISWEFPKEQQHLVKEFQLNRSTKAEGNYDVVVRDIPKSETTVAFNDLYATNYFSISAIPHEGKPTTSFPILLQPLDTTPPKAPTGLKGHIDTLGNVTLSWEQNTEKDILGYKVYQAFTEKEKPILIHNDLIKDTNFSSAVEVKNLNRRAYYALVAIDQNFNHSPFSEILIIDKPDLIPPTAPLISGYQVKPNGIEISWINSESEGVVAHQIYRKTENQDSDVLIATVEDPNKTTHIDQSVEPNVKYIYAIYALKDKGLKSSSSPTLTVSSANSNRSQFEISRFDATVDNQNNIIKLTWSDNLKDQVQYYEIYKGNEDEKISLWKTLSADIFEILDTEIQAQKQYQYLIRAIGTDGRNTKTKELKIKY